MESGLSLSRWESFVMDYVLLLRCWEGFVVVLIFSGFKLWSDVVGVVWLETVVLARSPIWLVCGIIVGSLELKGHVNSVSANFLASGKDILFVTFRY